jgi:hypothetical protein
MRTSESQRVSHLSVSDALTHDLVYYLSDFSLEGSCRDPENHEEKKRR